MKNIKYKYSNHLVYSCKYHIVWCTKYRRKVLTGEVEVRLKEIIIQTAYDLKVEIIEMETNQDHIHILADINPSLGVMKFIHSVKGRSSRILRDEFPSLKTRIPTLWTTSCFISTIGGAPLDAVKQYIENQQTSERVKQKTKWNNYVKNI